ncbi:MULTISPECIES: LCP family protein [unclassified Pseudofrankia]|uniref:LCP family protein n=1 Tax=unclassified Pseudofrankia TaxID=2994372 RepID=UPI000A7C37B1|nr:MULTISPECIES: LCP family protein [unclassified Pseudofrankia]MDT3443060.1 LCP family protein [Pseudofrankia sp. BMG5.37]
MTWPREPRPPGRRGPSPRPDGRDPRRNSPDRPAAGPGGPRPRAAAGGDAGAGPAGGSRRPGDPPAWAPPPADAGDRPPGGDRYRDYGVGGGYGGGGQRGGYPYGEPAEDYPIGEPARRPADGARRAVTVVAALCSLVVLVLACTGWGVIRHYDGKVAHVDLRLDAADRPSAAGRGTQNILLVGSDSRAGTGGEFGEVDGQRSDTTILAHVDRNGSTTLVSFPRDLWVTIPAYTGSNGTAYKAQQSKLNAAFSLGGPALLVRTLEGLTGIRIDHYVQVDFSGFQAITDALGGVTVCVRELPASLRARGFDNLHDKMSGWSGQVGENRLDGVSALAFVRQRYGLPEGDLDRIRRQQQFLGAVFHRLTAASTLANPVRIRGVLNAATSALTLDTTTSLVDLEPLALRMQGIAGGGGLTFATVPAASATRAGQSVLLVDPAKLEAFLAPLKSGGAVAGGAPAAAPPAARRPVVDAPPVRRAWLAAGSAQPTAQPPATASCTY